MELRIFLEFFALRGQPDELSTLQEGPGALDKLCSLFGGGASVRLSTGITLSIGVSWVVQSKPGDGKEESKAKMGAG